MKNEGVVCIALTGLMYFLGMKEDFGVIGLGFQRLCGGALIRRLLGGIVDGGDLEVVMRRDS